jgi:hypothetical protein
MNASQSSLVSSGTIDEIESLFLVHRFTEALARCEEELAQCFNFNMKSIGNTPVTDQHLVDASIRLVSLVIQILYELKRSSEIMPFVINFYGGLEHVPFGIIYMCINLQVTLNNLTEAKNIIFHSLNRFTPVEVWSSELSSDHVPQEDYSQLIELYLFHVLDLDTAHRVISGEISAQRIQLPEHSRTEFAQRILQAKKRQAEQLTDSATDIQVPVHEPSSASHVDKSATTALVKPIHSVNESKKPLTRWHATRERVIDYLVDYGNFRDRDRLSHALSNHNLVLSLVSLALAVLLLSRRSRARIIGLMRKFFAFIMSHVHELWSMLTLVNGQTPAPPRVTASSTLTRPLTRRLPNTH